MRFAALVLLAAVTGCAHYPVNPPLESYDPATRVPVRKLLPPGNSEKLLLILTFSGGGTRAAALSYGLLEELAATEIVIEGRTRRLLDEVDIISAISGGSFTAAYYGLYGEQIFADFEERFLKKDVQGGLGRKILSPVNWIRLSSPFFGRSELAAEYYDEHLFSDATFADLTKRRGPAIIINATDMIINARFGFVRNQFERICSDLSKVRLSRAIVASSAVPLVLSPVTLRNYAGSCGYPTPAWIEEALQSPELGSRKYHQARWISDYLDAERKPYIHLLDGGLSDNLGLRALIDEAVRAGSARKALEETGLEATEKIAFIIVNAQTGAERIWSLSEHPPPVRAVVLSAKAALVDRYSFETVEFLRSSIRQWSAEGTESPEFYLAEVGFDSLRDEEEKDFLKGLPTSLTLPDDAVDRLRAAAGEALRNSPEFQRLLNDLDGVSP